MSVPRRVIVLAFLVAVGVLTAAARTRPGRLTQFDAPAIPQRAFEDLDGDGRSDTAHISIRSRISVQLSTSFAPVELDGPVAGVVAGDVDHDGDVDLVAATPSGDLKVYLNDGRGRFTSQEPARRHTLVGESVTGYVDSSAALVLWSSAPSIRSIDRDGALVASTRIGPPTAPVPFKSTFFVLASLRAPPSPSTELL